MTTLMELAELGAKAVRSRRSVTVLLTSGCIVYLLYKGWRSWSRKLPPGPGGWPWLGYTACLGSSGFREIESLRQRHGDVFAFTLIGKTLVILNSLETIREAAIDNRNKVGRYTLFINGLLAKGYGISNYDTGRAMELKKALLRHLYGSTHMKSYLTNQESEEGNTFRREIKQEIDALIDELRHHARVPISIIGRIRRTVWKIIWKIMFGDTCPMNGAEIDDILGKISENNTQNSMFQPGQLLPDICMPLLRRSSTLQKLFNVENIISRYQEVFGALSDQVDKILSGKETQEWSVLHGLLTDEKLRISSDELKRLAFELMAAGTDTTTLTISWACEYLSRLPAGDLGPDNLAHHLDEIHRLASVVPLALPHIVREAFTLRDYYIPKGSILVYNLNRVHCLQLAQDRLTCPRQEAIPFSLGSRSCPGMRLANRLVSDILTTLHDSFVIEEGHVGNGNPEKMVGLTRGPCMSLFVFRERTALQGNSDAISQSLPN